MVFGFASTDLLSAENCQQHGLELSNPRISKQKWYLFEQHSDVEKIFEFTDSDGHKRQKIGLTKRIFRAIEEVLDGKRQQQDIENRVRELLTNPEQDFDSKVKILLSDPCFKKFSQTK